MTARLLDGNQLVAWLEDYEAIEWTRPYLVSGALRMTINRHKPSARSLRRGLCIEPPGETGLVYLIEQIESQIDADGRITDTLVVAGRDLGGLFAARVCVPPTGASHDVQIGVAVETAMKYYVNAHAGPGAVAGRAIPRLTIGANQARGVIDTFQVRYQYLSEVLAELGGPSAMGWQVLLDYASGNYIFDVVLGRDFSVGDTAVYVDIDFATALSQQWLISDLDRRTFAYVAGQGEGVARTVLNRWSGVDSGVPAPTGLDRREVFIDARDLSEVAALKRRGDAKLAETQSADSFTATINQFGSFRYKTHWDLGDLVVVRNRAWGVQQAARIVTVKLVVTERSARQPAISVELGRPWPTLRERLAGDGIGAGAGRV